MYLSDTWHSNILAAQGAIAMEDSEDKDDGRLENESRDMEDG